MKQPLSTVEREANRAKAIAKLRRDCIHYGMEPNAARRASVTTLWLWRTRALKDLIETVGGRGCL